MGSSLKRQLWMINPDGVLLASLGRTFWTAIHSSKVHIDKRFLGKRFSKFNFMSSFLAHFSQQCHHPREKGCLLITMLTIYWESKEIFRWERRTPCKLGTDIYYYKFSEGKAITELKAKQSPQLCPQEEPYFRWCEFSEFSLKVCYLGTHTQVGVKPTKD